jgi:hypothetical protein
MPAKSSGVEPTSAPTSEAKMPIGFEFERDDGDGTGPKVWVYVQNGDAGAWVAGNAIARKDGTATKIGVKSPVSSAPHRIMGFCQQAFPQNYYGFILRRGSGTVLASNDGGITANTAFTIGANDTGAVDTVAAVTGDSLGWAPVAIAAQATGTAYVDCRG